jgi:putative ABC transport system permease protein
LICPGGFPGDDLYLGRPTTPVHFRVVATTNSPWPELLLAWCIGSKRALDSIASPTLGTTILLSLQPREDTAAFALDVRRQMFGQGIDATTIQEFRDQSHRALIWFITLFTDLFQFGLFVGVLALGMLALRAVIERRRSIGILRALGYMPKNILVAFLVESFLIATIGIASGVAVGFPLGGIFLAGSPYTNAIRFNFNAGWLWIPIGIVYVAILLATLAPSVRASKLAPSMALRLVD